MVDKSHKYAFSLAERHRLKISKTGEPDFDNMVYYSNLYFRIKAIMMKLKIKT